MCSKGGLSKLQIPFTYKKNWALLNQYGQNDDLQATIIIRVGGTRHHNSDETALVLLPFGSSKEVNSEGEILRVLGYE
jgi:hypothetical protein